MHTVYERAVVRVSVTMVSMGPGFDPFGVVFRYYDEVSARPTTGTTRVIIEGVGAETASTDDDNLIAQALRAGLGIVDVLQASSEMRCVNRIPYGGGMGSSASTAVVGLILACGLTIESEVFSDDRVFILATDFGGHPDDVVPAVFGDVTAAWVERGGRLRMAPIPLDASLGASPPIPPVAARLSTKGARQVLPVSMPYEDALLNTSRVAMLMLAPAGHPDLLTTGAEDRLHQEYRRGVLSALMAVMDLLREQDYPAVTSGAGPTVLVLSTLTDQTRFVLENHGRSVPSSGVDTRGVILTPWSGRVAPSSAFLIAGISGPEGVHDPCPSRVPGEAAEPYFHVGYAPYLDS